MGEDGKMVKVIPLVRWQLLWQPRSSCPLRTECWTCVQRAPLHQPSCCARPCAAPDQGSAGRWWCRGWCSPPPHTPTAPKEKRGQVLHNVELLQEAVGRMTHMHIWTKRDLGHLYLAHILKTKHRSDSFEGDQVLRNDWIFFFYTTATIFTKTGELATQIALLPLLMITCWSKSNTICHTRSYSLTVQVSCSLFTPYT